MDSFVGGAAAGLAVDLLLYPLDTVKTRLQSKAGFWASGGFSGVYQGLRTVSVGSVPGGALFFTAYDMAKQALPAGLSGQLLASAVGEGSACLVRVPTEMVKQRMQVCRHSSMTSTLRNVVREGGVLHLYSGYPVTIAREVPFAAVQMPLYEFFKQHSPQQSPLAFALCGSAAGGIAAAVTTPLDVAKTRLMLGESGSKSLLGALAEVARVEGGLALFKGIGPRVMWITIGGTIFFGTYEGVKRTVPAAPLAPS